MLTKSKIKRFLLLFLGTFSLSLGLIGIILPLLPTTPFLLLAAACYIRSSEKFYNWLINHKIFGKYIKDYMDKKGIPLKVKIMAISFLWIAILFSIFFILSNQLIQILLMIIAIAVTTHILLLKTIK